MADLVDRQRLGLAQPARIVEGLLLEEEADLVARAGEIIVGGSGKNEYLDDFSLIIDVGGDDKYSGRAGGTDGGA